MNQNGILKKVQKTHQKVGKRKQKNKKQKTKRNKMPDLSPNTSIIIKKM